MGTESHSKDYLLQQIDQLKSKIELLQKNVRTENDLSDIRKKGTRFTDLVDHSLLWNWETDTAGKYRFASMAVETILGYPPEEIIDKYFYDFCPSGEIITEKKRFHSLVKKQKPIKEYITQNIRKNGDIVWLSRSAVPIYDDGNEFSGYRGIDIDITELKLTVKSLQESEEKYRKLMEGANDAIFIAETETGLIIDANHNAIDLLGTDRDSIIGKHITDIHPPEFKEKYRKLFKKLIDKGKALSGEIILLDNNNMEIPIEISSSLSDWKGKRIIQCIYRDLRERKKIEEERMRTSKLESLGLLAGGIAHDLNNLLTAIWGNLTLTKLYVDKNAAAVSTISALEEILQDAKKLTHQFLTFSRGGLPIKKTFDTIQIIKDAVSFSLSGTKLACDFEIEESLGSIDIDEEQLKQAINNVILNASQCMKSGGIIKVTAEKCIIDEFSSIPVSPGEFIMVAIQDQGPGIPDNILHRVFDPYFTTNKGQQGLGLSVTYSIIRNHGGYVTAESMYGKHTSIIIYLPVSCKKHELSAQSKPGKITPLHMPQKQSQRRSIMIMDDEENIRKTTGQMLKLLGYHVYYACDGNEAIETVTQLKEQGDSIDLIIMDLTIPGGMGGEETVSIIKDIDKSIVPIVSSGYCESPVMSNYAQYGFHNVLPKPYTIEELSKKIQDCFKSPGSHLP